MNKWRGLRPRKEYINIEDMSEHGIFCPHCGNKKHYYYGAVSTTMGGWTTLKDGNTVELDPNTKTATVRCVVCGTDYSYEYHQHHSGDTIETFKTWNEYKMLDPINISPQQQEVLNRAEQQKQYEKRVKEMWDKVIVKTCFKCPHVHAVRKDWGTGHGEILTFNCCSKLKDTPITIEGGWIDYWDLDKACLKGCPVYDKEGKRFRR